MNQQFLEQLTSPGLVRRANKILQKESPAIEKTHSSVEYSLEGMSGTLDVEDITKSRCSCNVQGLCKHLVAVALFVIENEDACEVKVPAVEPDALMKSAGREAVRRVYKLYTLSASYSGTRDGAVVHIEINGQAFSFTKAQHIDDLIGDSASKAEKLWGIYLYSCEQGVEWQWPDWLLVEQTQIQTSLKTLQTELKAALLCVWWVGIHRVRSAHLLDLQLLIIPLAKAGLKAESQACKRIIGAYQRFISGEGLRDELVIMTELAYLLVLIEQPISEVKSVGGQDQTTLFCLGPEPWQSVGRAQGLTILFQSSDGQIFSASEARANTSGHFDSEHVARYMRFWETSKPAMELMGNLVSFNKLEVNEYDRIRRTQSTEVIATEKGAPFVYYADFSTIEWSAQPYIVIAPDRFHHLEFDQALQQFQLQYRDANKNTLTLTVPYQKNHALLMKNMTALEGLPVKYIACNVSEKGNQIQLRPFALQQSDGVQWQSLYFDQISTESRFLDRWRAKFNARTTAVPGREITQLQQLLADFSRWLCAFPYQSDDEVRIWQGKLEQLGLYQLSVKLQQNDDFDLLRCFYMLYCLRKADVALPVILYDECT
ncbi:hypothetical protein PRUB_a1884 [Pseudoalteromonas rubra]|uniref:SWIM-type domain-containing protein n=1 Tax=Pseudoalteromonas rubra TaxID=43658 RepID=A0A8T0CE45_9GAMM|nr:SWIM zinc finger family protein [Pseudoalteromonas rubra]KAF7788810.1 hypothetical protein PRUB_a1884 [Pseudoalteromonas rubra]